MTHLTLEYPRHDAKTLLKAAFERTDGISSYSDNGNRIVGKTGFRLASYGESVIVEVPREQPDPERTSVSITAEREVPINVTANPERYERAYLAAVDALRGRSIESILDEVAGDGGTVETKEVAAGEQYDGRSVAGWVVAAVLIATFLVFLVMLP